MQVSIREELYKIESNYTLMSQLRLKLIQSQQELLLLLSTVSPHINLSEIKQIIKNQTFQFNQYSKQIIFSRNQIYNAYLKKPSTNQTKNALVIELLKISELCKELQDSLSNNYSNLKMLVDVACQKDINRIQLSIEACYIDNISQIQEKDYYDFIIILEQIETIEITNNKRLLISSDDLIQTSQQ
ncbi:hypothetical protein SS50377_20263 [Spironucleus salmonicida]|uniref:Uncharacterized protein n=1 Tax=Spironucleus salmonicida TaxID=348837 RepID=V6LL90_9EUKA|nr:hypothetical protein SS50377_20263 [Spironucleus salmonicida]|eukprot:EST45317.1 Hypothetical protein SS50377_14894 [Spironucleus salmonicida]